MGDAAAQKHLLWYYNRTSIQNEVLLLCLMEQL